MKSIEYKDYLIMFEKTTQGVRSVAVSDYDTIRVYFIDYAFKEIVKRMKKNIDYRLTQFS